MHATRLVTCFVALILVLAACSRNSDESASTTGALARGIDPPPPPAAVPTALDGAGFEKREADLLSMPTPRMAAAAVAIAAREPGAAPVLIRSGSARLEVKSLPEALRAATGLAERAGATVGNVTTGGGRHQVASASLEIRVAAERFQTVVDGLSAIGTVEHLDVRADDVSEEFVDLAARLANSRRLESRLVELLGNRAARLADILQVERELARVREEIERAEGRLRFLQSRAAESRLTIAMSEPPPKLAGVPGRSPIREALLQAWRNLVAVTAGIIASLGAVLPFAVIGGALYLTLGGRARRWVRTRSARAS